MNLSLDDLKNKIKVYLEAGQSMPAIKLLESFIEENPKDSDVYNLLGIAQFHQEHFKQAIEAFQKSKKDDRHLHLFVTLCELGLYEKAKNSYKKTALSSSCFLAKSHTKTGEAYLHYNKNKEAISEFKKAKTLDPSLEEASLGLAEAQINDKRYDDAINTLEKIDHLAEAHIFLGIAYFKKNNQQKACFHWQKSRELAPHLPAAKAYGKLADQTLSEI